MIPLNYSTKALEQFTRGGGHPSLPITSAAIAYIRDKLASAEKFLMPEGGRLLAPDAVKPEVPGLVFRPPFPVVALEYGMRPDAHEAAPNVYNGSHAPKRIALAWDWQNDFPAIMSSRAIEELEPGVCVMEISWRSEVEQWMPGLACLHIPYEGAWETTDEVPPFVRSMLERGKISERLVQPGRRAYRHTIVPMLAEAIAMKALRERSVEAAIDLIRADTHDELISYIDLCYALACKNVSIEAQPASDKLNRSRAKAGKPPLADYRVLVLNGAAGSGGSRLGADDRNGPRPHLRRGHIRRLGPTRITWVNPAMVRGKGAFAAKAYGLRAGAVA